MALSSCAEEALAPLTGEYQEPDVYTMTELLSQETIAGKGYKTFVVEVASEGVTGKAGEYKGTGNALELHFLGEGYKLASTTYAAATPDKAQKGTYLTGDTGSKYYTIKDDKAEALLIDNGGIKVNEGEDGYTLEGIIWLENGDVVEISCKAKLVYEKVLTKLTQAITVTSNVANGTNSVTMNLATDGITSELDMTTWQTVYKGTGNYLAIDVYSADGFVYPGTYKPCAKSGEIAEGEYQIGWDPGDIYNIGMAFTNWGTCWWTVTDGATSAAHITKGDITIELDAEGIYTLTVDNGDVYAIYEGPLGDVTPEVKGQYKMTQAFSAVNNAPYGKETVTVKLATKKLTATYSKKNEVYSFSGTGEYVSLELASADGTLAPGTYKTADKTLVTGALKDNGTGMVEGSFLSHVTDGKEAPTSVELILDGQVEVALNDDVYTIVATFGENTCTYEGPVTVVTPEVKEPEPEIEPAPEPEAGFTKLTVLQAFQSNLASGVQSLTFQLANDGYTITQEGYNQVITGEGYYLSMDIYSEDGKLHTGTYNANTVGGQLGAGQFGIGYDTTVDWGFGPMEMKDWGTCWWTVANGGATAEKVLDGTVIVSVVGEDLVIKLKSTLVNARFTYPVEEFSNVIEVAE